MTGLPAEKMTVLRAVFAVDCPDCFAGAGEPCFDEGGTEYVAPHANRFDRLSGYVQRAEELYEAQDGAG